MRGRPPDRAAGRYGTIQAPGGVVEIGVVASGAHGSRNRADEPCFARGGSTSQTPSKWTTSRRQIDQTGRRDLGWERVSAGSMLQARTITRSSPRLSPGGARLPLDQVQGFLARLYPAAADRRTRRRPINAWCSHARSAGRIHARQSLGKHVRLFYCGEVSQSHPISGWS